MVLKDVYFIGSVYFASYGKSSFWAILILVKHDWLKWFREK